MLIQMAGFPGSGKSTISIEVAKRTNAIVIDRDIIKSSMLRHGLDNNISSKLSYDMLYDLVEFYLSQEISVIIDTPCYFDEIIERGKQLSAKYCTQYRFLECIVDCFEIVEERIALRNNMISQVTKPSEEGFENAKLGAKRPDDGCMQINTTSLSTIDYEKICRYLEIESKEISKITIG